LNEATNSLKLRFIIGSDPFMVAAQLFDGGKALGDGAQKPVPQIVASLVFQARDVHDGFHGVIVSHEEPGFQSTVRCCGFAPRTASSVMARSSVTSVPPW
jgi:hypothetical protein